MNSFNSWRMETMCDDCPFQKTGKGAALAKSLRKGRFESIKRSLLRGELFECHKTVTEDGEGDVMPGTGLLCAGGLEFMKKHKVDSQFVRICERLEARQR